MKTYFKDNFFSVGKTDIWNEQLVSLGYLDLKSAFGSAIDVYDATSMLVYSGKSPLLSRRWQVFNAEHAMVGQLRYKMSMLSKKYSYEAEGRGMFFITSPAFSRSYEVSDANGVLVASFQKVNGWLSPGAYCLDHTSEQLSNFELIAVIMGVNAIQKMNNAAAANA